MRSQLRRILTAFARKAAAATATRAQDKPEHHDIGRGTYGDPQVLSWDEGSKLSIGAFCSFASGVTIILTTHYIEEAEDMADRIGVISKGKIILVEEKAELMRKLGKKQLMLQLQEKLDAIPETLAEWQLSLSQNGMDLTYTYDTQRERTGITKLLGELSQAGIRFRDLQTTQSSLEEIFVGLVRQSQ